MRDIQQHFEWYDAIANDSYGLHWMHHSYGAEFDRLELLCIAVCGVYY